MNALSRLLARFTFLRWMALLGLCCGVANATTVQTIGPISFLPTSLVVGGTTTASATATSGLAVSFTRTTLSTCTVSGNIVTGVAAGTCTVVANQYGNVNYAAAPQVAQSITVNKASQTIGPISFSPTSLAIGGITWVSVTASSGLAVSLSSSVTPTICSVSGNTVTGLLAGICTVTASQTGNTNYLAATPVTGNITVKIGQTISPISFTPSTLALGGTSTASATGGASGNPVTYGTTSLASVCTVSSGGLVTATGVGNCVVVANQAGNGTYADAPGVQSAITVNKGSQYISAISFTPSTLALGGTSTATATATSGLAVSFLSSTPSVCTVSGSTVTGVANGICTVSAEQTGNVSYFAASPVTQDISVGQRPIPMIAVGAKHSCSLSNSGAVKCWGDNTYSQLGNGNTTRQMTAVNVTGMTSGVIAITAGANHTCALTSSGGVQCWGRNDTGQLGDNSNLTRSTPVAVTNMTSGVIAISASFGHTCAITTGGAVKCWGLNNFGQLGDNTSGTNRLTAVAVNGLSSGVTALATGNGHTCALSDTTGVKCWGDNFYGQLGDGSTTPHLTPWDVSGLATGVSAITAGTGYTCALTIGGGVKCWGLNNLSQLGDGGTTGRITPWDVVGLTSGVTAIVASSTHTCALISGSVKCWGYNNYGQLGDNSLTNRSTAVDVIGFSGEVTMIAAGDEHSCALTLSGGVKCWGRNDIGQLGDGGLNTAGHNIPWDVNGMASGVSAIAVGSNYTCAVTTGGGAKCWGYNGSGQLGDGTATNRRIPTDVSGLTSGVSMVSSGGAHTCALTTTGGVKCWGNNSYGQLGDGTNTQQPTAVNVSGLTSGVIAVAVGSSHTCALTTTGGVKCWGYNGTGQLGDGTTTQRLTAVDVTGLTSGVIAIAAGQYHTCAVTTVGGVKCWGNNNYGQLGDGTNTQGLTAVDVSGLTSGASAIAAGDTHTCALIRGAGVKCWGYGASYGALGSYVSQSNTPVDVSGLTGGVSAIVASGDPHGGHNCALTTAGGIKCWGAGFYGQLGNGSSSYSYTPIDVSGLSSGVSAVATGYYNTCALTTSEGMKCWGSNSYGQLGDGTADTRPYAALFVVGLLLIDNPTLAATPKPSVINQSVTYTAIITGLAPIGTVTFNFGDGSTSQTVALSGGQAVATHTFTSGGSFIVTANYSGDNTNMPSTSLPLTQTVITVPDAPAISSFTAVNGSVTLVFTAPASNGGADISGYKATCGTTTITGSFPQITVSPLTNGASYNCTVLASNSVGDGPPSTAVSVTPTGIPVVGLSSTSLTFANQNINTISPAQTVTLSNTGDAALAITSIQSSINVFAVTHSCGNSLAAHASCNLYVTFAPLVIGNRTGAVTITSNPMNGLLLTVSGTGAANAPVCTLTAMPARIPPGRSTTLTPTCTPAATTYAWTGGTCEGTTASTCTVTPASTTVYGVTGTNTYGSSTANAQVTVKAVDLTPILMLLLD